MFKFLVDSISPEGLIVGRNGDRDIPVGTTFTDVRQCRVLQDVGGCRTEELVATWAVSLVLREVHWYSHTLDHVPGGHSAGLGVAGDGMAKLAGWLKEFPSPHSSLWLVALERQ